MAEKRICRKGGEKKDKNWVLSLFNAEISKMGIYRALAGYR